MSRVKDILILLTLVLLTAKGNSAADVSKGDIFILKDFDLYQLHREDNYTYELIIKNGHWPLFDIDRKRQRIYFRLHHDKFFYLDLNAEPRVLKKVDFIPEDMWISSVAGDGSSLILYKKVYDDIFAEENPLFERPYGGIRFYMLFRYDMATGEITRLTYSNSQEDSWVSTDGRCLAFRRYSWFRNTGEWDDTIIFCRADGMLKYDLGYYFRKAGLDLNEYRNHVGFAPKLEEGASGAAGYYAVFRPKNYAEVEKIKGKVEYYFVTVRYEGKRLKCGVDKKRIRLPDDLVIYHFFSEFSNLEEVYLGGEFDDGRGGLIRYDVDAKTFSVIPMPVGSGGPFLVY
jgi:hypothetical protein